MTSGPYKSIIFSALFLYSIIFLNILCSPLQYLLCVIHILLCMLLAGMYKSPDVFYNFICLCSIHPCHFKCYNVCDIVYCITTPVISNLFFKCINFTKPLVVVEVPGIQSKMTTTTQVDIFFIYFFLHILTPSCPFLSNFYCIISVLWISYKIIPIRILRRFEYIFQKNCDYPRPCENVIKQFIKC